MTNSNRHMSLRGLRTFCIAAEEGSFRDAAERLHITASAVSHQIKNLETELGRDLFERGTRSVHLTQAGESLYNDLRPILGELDAVANRHRSDATRQALRISVQPFFASELFVPGLQDFNARHPDIDVTVDTSDESSERHPAHADASIRIFHSEPDGLVYRELFPLRLIPAGSPAFYDDVRVRGNNVISEFPVVIHASRPRVWTQWERSSGIRLPRNRRAVTMDSMIAVVRAAEQGLGAALVPVQLSDRWFRNGSLVPLFDHEMVTRDTYYFTYRESRNDEAVRALEHWVLQTFADNG